MLSLPANLRLGANFMFPLADYHTLAIGLDLNKLLVPTKPRPKDFDMSTSEGQTAYNEALDKWNTMSPITAIFKSFSDAPGGAKEELQEIGVSFGAEYVYNQQFSSVPVIIMRMPTREDAAISRLERASRSMWCVLTHPTCWRLPRAVRSTRRSVSRQHSTWMVCATLWDAAADDGPAC